MPAAPCVKCSDGWICEQHPEKGWPHDDCAGPGMPCPSCQPSGRPTLPRGMAVYRLDAPVPCKRSRG